jgi:hypothetical protein
VLHSIHITVDGPVCSCGFTQAIDPLKEATELAREHADKNRPAVIHPTYITKELMNNG